MARDNSRNSDAGAESVVLTITEANATVLIRSKLHDPWVCTVFHNLGVLVRLKVHDLWVCTKITVILAQPLSLHYNLA